MTEPESNQQPQRDEEVAGDSGNGGGGGLSAPPPPVGEDSAIKELQKEHRESYKEEEMKLKKKFPTAVRPGGSLFLQKKLLQRDKKYFDSGDYNMARGQAAKGPQPKLKGKTITGERLVVPDEPTGDSHPSPELIPQRKVSISQASKLVSPNARETTIPGGGDGGNPMTQHPLARINPAVVDATPALN